MPKLLIGGGGQNSLARGYLAQFVDFIKSHKIFFVFVVFYCAILIAFSRYAPNFDDTWIWLKIIEGDSKEVWTSFRPQIGRFYPLAFLDLLILMKISTSPYLFFGFNALLFALFCIIYIKILELSNGKSALNSAIVVLVSLSFGFVIVFFGICYPEKIQIIWLSIFMLFSLRTLQNPTHKNQLFGIIFLNIALYYKEPTFAAAFAFGVVLLIFALKNRQRDLVKYAFCVILSSCYFVLLYYLLVVSEIDKTYSALVAKNLCVILWEYALNDSLLPFGVGGILLWRIYCVAIKKARIEPFFDGLLAGSFAYFMAFIVLKMSAPYYLLPCYVLGIPALLYFSRKYFHILFIKICIILGLFGFFTQNLPTGIYKMIDLKAQGVQYHRTLDFVASYLSANQSVDIYFAGIGRGRDIYDFEVGMQPFWFADYLERLHGIKDFDLRTNAPNGANFHADKKSKFTLANSEIIDTPKNGDLIIVSNKGAFGDSLQKSQENGELIFKSGFHTIPYVALVPLVQYVSANHLSVNLKNTNFFRMPTETYIFKVR